MRNKGRHRLFQGINDWAKKEPRNKEKYFGLPNLEIGLRKQQSSQKSSWPDLQLSDPIGIVRRIIEPNNYTSGNKL